MVLKPGGSVAQVDEVALEGELHHLPEFEVEDVPEVAGDEPGHREGGDRDGGARDARGVVREGGVRKRRERGRGERHRRELQEHEEQGQNHAALALLPRDSGERDHAAQGLDHGAPTSPRSTSASWSSTPSTTSPSAVRPRAKRSACSVNSRA